MLVIGQELDMSFGTFDKKHLYRLGTNKARFNSCLARGDMALSSGPDSTVEALDQLWHCSPVNTYITLIPFL